MAGPAPKADRRASRGARTRERGPRPWGPVCRFLRDTRGAAGFTAALLTVMTLGATALITDHIWLYSRRDMLQAASDAASTAVALRLGTLPTSMSDANVKNALQPVAERWALANVHGLVSEDIPPEDVTVTVDVDRSAGLVDVTVEAPIGKTLIASWVLGFLGPGEIAAGSGMELAMAPAEVVLVLDTTRSMQLRYGGTQTRLAATRAAARDLVDILSPSDVGPVAVGLVPWTTMVRLDDSARSAWSNAGWAAFPDQRRYRWPYTRWGRPAIPSPSVQTIPRTVRGTWPGCLEEARIESGIADLPARADALATPDSTPFAEAYSPARPYTSHSCFGASPPSDFRRQDCWDEDSATGSMQFSISNSAQQVCRSMAPIMPLTTDASAIERAIDGLRSPGRMTYSAVGLQWGRRLLSPAWRSTWGDAVHPADPADPEYTDLRKVIVLLTDGQDNLCGADSDCARSGGVAARASHACTDAKADGIEIFVVAAMPPSAVNGAFARRLRACATSNEHVYINNSNAAALREAFRDIATGLATLRRVS